MWKSCLCALVVCLSACAAEVDERESMQKAFRGVKTVEVDNVFGSIDVTGYTGQEVTLTAEKRLRADSPEKAVAARQEVKLQITEQNGTLRLYVDGPFRDCKCDGSNHGATGYRVNYDFVLKVPLETMTRLKSINDGHILVAGTTGDYDVDNVNGGVEMRDVSGAGRVHALNGKVEVSFRGNPRAACFFGSLNGEVRVSFQPGLSADLRFKTFNGGVYTDFPVAYLPIASPVAERRNGKFVYKSDRFYGVRVGNGGPELKFDSFNGNIKVLERGR